MMNKYYSLLGIGLLSVASLTSCQEDERMGENNPESIKGVLRTYTVTAGIQGDENDKGRASSRANVQEDGRSFMWNTGDKVTLWDGESGYVFTAEGDNLDEKPVRKTLFSGKAAFVNGAKVWGIYPETTAANPFVFTLSENAVQLPGGKPALRQTMYMCGEGVVEGNEVLNLNFTHLTALYQFNVTTTRNTALTVRSVQVEADAAVFPTQLTVGTGEPPYTYGEKKTTLTLDMSSSELSPEGTVVGYMNFFPTEGLTGETELTFRVTLAEKGKSEEVVEVKKAKVNALYANPGSKVPTEGYVAGKRYVVNLNIGLSEGDSGYTQQGNEYIVYAPVGLTSIPSEVWADEGNTVRLNKDLDMAEAGEWKPVTTLKAVFDGAGKTVSNLAIASGVDGTGMFVNNEGGTIQQLVLENVSVPASNTKMGLLVVDNNGTIKDCVIKNAVASVSSGEYAGLITGINRKLIQDCIVEGESSLRTSGIIACGGVSGKSDAGTIKGCAVKGITIHSTGGDVSAFLGNAGPNTTLEGCSVTGTIQHDGENTWIGGMVGMAWTQNLVLKLCYAAVDVNSSDKGGSSIGGIVAQGGGQGSKTLSGVYSTSTAQGNSAGRFSQMVRNAVSVTCNECYFTSGTACEKGELSGTSLANASAIRSKASQLNAVAPDSEYEFVVNEVSDREPLVLRKK